MNLVPGAILLILSLEVVSAQPASRSSQQTQLAHQLLSSSRWIEKRGAPTLQGLLHSEELDEQLIEQFRVASSLRDWPAYTEEHAFVNVLLDAAIESGTMIPSPLLEPFEGKWTDAKREPNYQRPLSESRRPYKPWVSRRDIEQSIPNSVNSSTSELGRGIWLPETGCWSQHQSKYRIGPEVEVTQCTPTRCGLA